MADDSIEAKALALVNEIEREEGENELTRRIMRGLIMDEALCRALEQHEAFKQEVSDAVEAVRYFGISTALYQFDAFMNRFIIPKPKPDPLVAVVYEVDNGPAWDSPEDYCNKIRAALEARGLEIREKVR
jgi:hypothetical protein